MSELSSYLSVVSGDLNDMTSANTLMISGGDAGAASLLRHNDRRVAAP